MMSKNAKMACYLLAAVAVVIGVYYLGKHMQWWGEEHFYFTNDSKEDKKRKLDNLLSITSDIAVNESKYETIKAIKEIFDDAVESGLINNLPKDWLDSISEKSMDNDYKEFLKKQDKLYERMSVYLDDYME